MVVHGRWVLGNWDGIREGEKKDPERRRLKGLAPWLRSLLPFPQIQDRRKIILEPCRQ